MPRHAPLNEDRCAGYPLGAVGSACCGMSVSQWAQSSHHSRGADCGIGEKPQVLARSPACGSESGAASTRRPRGRRGSYRRVGRCLPAAKSQLLYTPPRLGRKENGREGLLACADEVAERRVGAGTGTWVSVQQASCLLSWACLAPSGIRGRRCQSSFACEGHGAWLSPPGVQMGTVSAGAAVSQGPSHV